MRRGLNLKHSKRFQSSFETVKAKSWTS